MRRWARHCGISAALALLSIALRGHAAPREPAIEVSVDGHLGQSTAPYFTSAFPTTSGYGTSLLLGARLRIAARWQLGLRVPLVLMRVEQPAGALYAEAAWGNPELNATFQQPWLEHDGWRLTYAASLAIAAPLAEHDPAQLAGRALRLADALEGFSEPGLFTPGVLPVTPAGSLTLQSSRWRFAAELGLPLLLRVSDADLPAEGRTRSFGLTPVAAGEGQLRLLRWLSLAAAARCAIHAIAPVDDQAAAAQLLVAGRADFQLREDLSLSALLQAPVGGPLGGSTITGGLGIRGAF
jgi:hypothetical protein